MKIAAVSESPADEAAIQILCAGILDCPIDWNSTSFHRGGCDQLLRLLPVIIKQHYFNGDTDGLVVVLDSDKTPVPGIVSDKTSETRLDKVWEIIHDTQKALSPLSQVPQRERPLLFGVGLAVPSMEAWLRCGIDPQVSEARWITALAENNLPYNTLRLKRDVYGTERPSLDLETEKMREEAGRIVNDGLLPNLEKLFPAGFGSLARDLRKW